jgi:hypothetical protein
MHALQRRAPRVILQSQHLLANIALWLVLHHDGLLRVVVSGKTVYEKQQGSLLREVELRIARFCPNNGPCVEDDILPYEVLEDLKGKRQTLHSGTYEPASSLHHNPSVRQPLYNIPRLYPSESRATKSSIRVLVQHTAQSMVQWLLRVPLLPQVDFATFGFQAAPGEVFDSPKLSVTDILSQIPSIVNMKWGTAASGSVVYNSIKEEDELASGHDSDTTMDDFDPGLEKERELEEILPYFPILRDLLDEVRPNCRCPRCRSGDSQDESLLQPGCLRRVAFQEVLFLIAHAVADGFGCEDVSGSTKSDPVIEATTVLLLELCEGKKVLWDTWFSAAACVYLGCEFRHHVMDIENSGTTYAAIQCGNLSVLARWFNLTAALKVQGCFGLIQGKGTIGVLRPQAQDPDLFQFRGVEEEFAIIQTEHTEDTSSFVDRFPKTPLEAGETVELAPDSSTVRSDVFLVSASTNVYRFLFRVQSNSHNRVIDPSDAIIRVARGLTSYECRHTQQAKLRSGTVRQTSFLYTFDELLGRWSNIEGFYGVDKTGPAMMNVSVDKTLGIAPQPRRLVKMETPTSDAEEGPSQQENADDITTTDEWIHFSSVLTSRLQFNIALALAVNDAAVLNDGTSCFACVQDQVLAVPLPASQQMDEDDTVTRTVINMHPSLVEEAGRSKLKRKAITE